MNPANPAPNNGQQQQQNQPQRPNIFKMIMMYMVMNYVVTNLFKSGGQQAPSTAYVNVFHDSEPLELRVFISENETIGEDAVPVWEEKGLEYNYNKENAREKTIVFQIDELLKNNSDPKLFAHVVLESVRPRDSANYSDFSDYLWQQATINLIEWRKKINTEGESLLFKEEDKDEDKAKAAQEALNITTDNATYPHIKSKIWIQLVHDSNAYPRGQIPPEMSPKFVDTELGNRIYVPILDTAQFWLRKKDYIPIEHNAENNTVNTTLHFNTYWIYKYMAESQFKNSNQMYEKFGLTSPGDGNMDELKEMVLDTNPVLFAVTVIVSLLHSVFEFLALKNDIAFWKNVESHKGLSLRTLWVSLGTEVVVLLYLMDNDTSFLIIVSSIAELGVTIWKILKTAKFKKRADGKFPFVEIDYQDAYKSTTMEYDQEASKYLFYLFIPLLIGYAAYSLIYEKHKGWYSYVVQTLVGFIYVFGFIQMTPQLYINYKLKSVEHLPWRVLVYKFLNTIVDDLFAFVITMPWLKRLSCFRDDIIFIIYLYQRWHYRVDKNRDPYGNIKKDEPAVPAQPQAAVTAQTAEPSQQSRKSPKKESTIPANKNEASPEKDTITHRQVEGQAQTDAGSQEEAAQPQAAAAEKTGPKMKKKKVE